jgi:hypothetical protein
MMWLVKIPSEGKAGLMNERVQVTSQGFTTQYAFGLNGQRVSSWDGIACAPTMLSANTYWNGTPVSVFDGYQSSYQHQDLHCPSSFQLLRLILPWLWCTFLTYGGC